MTARPDPRAHADRLERERQFHDEVFTTKGERAATERFYSVDAGKRAYLDLLIREAADAQVLVYGCGPWSSATRLAQEGASVVGIDISPVAVERARRRARRAGVDAQYEVMDAHALDFEDSSFDVVCGSGILHHLDLSAALGEVARVLRPEGVAVFFEPLGTNPLINLYRRLTPRMRTPDEHPLVASDFRLAHEYFGVVRREEHTFIALFGAVMYRIGPARRLVPRLHQIDRWLFRRVPFTRHLAWTVVLRLAAPRAR